MINVRSNFEIGAGLTFQKGPFKYKRNEKTPLQTIPWKGGGVPAGGQLHAGHGNYLQVINPSSFPQKFPQPPLPSPAGRSDTVITSGRSRKKNGRRIPGKFDQSEQHQISLTIQQGDGDSGVQKPGMGYKISAEPGDQNNSVYEDSYDDQMSVQVKEEPEDIKPIFVKQEDAGNPIIYTHSGEKQFETYTQGTQAEARSFQGIGTQASPQSNNIGTQYTHDNIRNIGVMTDALNLIEEIQSGSLSPQEHEGVERSKNALEVHRQSYLSTLEAIQHVSAEVIDKENAEIYAFQEFLQGNASALQPLHEEMQGVLFQLRIVTAIDELNKIHASTESYLLLNGEGEQINTQQSAGVPHQSLLQQAIKANRSEILYLGPPSPSQSSDTSPKETFRLGPIPSKPIVIGKPVNFTSSKPGNTSLNKETIKKFYERQVRFARQSKEHLEKENKRRLRILSERNEKRFEERRKKFREKIEEEEEGTEVHGSKKRKIVKQARQI